MTAPVIRISYNFDAKATNPAGFMELPLRDFLRDLITQVNANSAVLNADIEAVDGVASSIQTTEVLTGAASSAFSAERLVTDTTSITWDLGTSGQAKADVSLSATDKVLGRVTAGAGLAEEIDCTAAGRALLDDADAAAQRTTLSLVDAYDSPHPFVMMGA